MNKVARFFRLPGVERRLFLEAVFRCASVRLVMLVLPFRKYVSLLGVPVKEKDLKDLNPVLQSKDALLQQIGTAVRRASRNVPWRTRCYVEAIAAKRMLKRRSIPCTIYLGLKKETDIDNEKPLENMAAHAWIISDDFIVTGKQGVKLKEYTVVSSFQ
jgi:hypothetical protein